MNRLTNEAWIAAAYENLAAAIAQGDYKQAKLIISDTMDQGFVQESRDMAIRLRESKELL